ncbi:MAG: NAD(P)-binding domain-containing protein [Gammaproteobacteria bacterium]|nr:NAD(P)-binding domain-containing protein [Gammaproteobacteria bacterium]
MRKLKQRRYKSIHKEAQEAGLTEPPSLHPLIDPALCSGCGACVIACPERPQHNVLGLINGKAALIDPSNCIGHGACAAACPYDAITLVFGTEKRGVDIPLLSPEFETNIPGIFIAGELGGMGLIRNAINQGQQAINSIASLNGIGKDDMTDVIIIGAGPAGFSASLQALSKGLKYITLEQESLGGTVFKFPRGKLVMTAPFHLPIIGSVRFRETTKEALLDFWTETERKTNVKINYGEKVDKIEKTKNGFCVTTNNNVFTARSVLLTIGRRGTPRKLNIPGEEMSKIVYHLIDPEQYRGQHVLIVGGGDSALEAATSIAAEHGTTVTLSYRSDAFSRAKKKNRDKIEIAEAQGKIKTLMSSNVKEFTQDSAIIERKGEIIIIKNDAAIICAGGILPTAFLKETGIQIETKYGTA